MTISAITEPSCIKAKCAKVKQLGNIFNFLQAQLEAALAIDKTLAQVVQNEETVASIDLHRKLVHGKEDTIRGRKSKHVCLQERTAPFGDKGHRAFEVLLG
jgi:hypothetical protein